MTFLNARRAEESRESPYATQEDFRKLFTGHANDLYLLSFLLTARHDMAERCFAAGLDECAEGNAVFQDWARSWARRIIIRNAIRILTPRPGTTRATPVTLNLAGNLPETRLQDAPFANILALEDFERFVYVLSVLEEYVDQNCAALLNTSQREIREARARALRHLADFAIGEAAPPEKLSLVRVA
jgi:DNA-directed RNA polymerase specialized sigma24 family protein